MRIISVFLCLLVAAAVGADSGNEQSTRRSEQRTKRGPVSAVVRVEPDSVRIGDPVSLIIEVTAQAEVELLMPVFGASLERFTILEFVPREHIDADGRTVFHPALSVAGARLRRTHHPAYHHRVRRPAPGPARDTEGRGRL